MNSSVSRFAISLLILGVLAACQATPRPSLLLPGSAMTAASVHNQAVTAISVEEAQAWLADPNAQWQLLDLRTPEEFATGHLKNATLMNFYDADFRERLLTMNRHQPTILYCRSGNRSGQALEIMRELGFRNVYDMQGGIMAWQRAGYLVLQP